MYNPIYERYFRDAAFVTSKANDDARSVLFRKHQMMWNMLADCKPSSIPQAALVERTGATALHHVLWLREEGTALRDSLSWREGRRGALWTRRAERQVHEHMSRVYRSLASLRSVLR